MRTHTAQNTTFILSSASFLKRVHITYSLYINRDARIGRSCCIDDVYVITATGMHSLSLS